LLFGRAGQSTEMWLVGLALALGLPSLLSPYVSLVMVAVYCVICLAGRINPAIIGLGLVFVVSWHVF